MPGLFRRQGIAPVFSVIRDLFTESVPVAWSNPDRCRPESPDRRLVQMGPVGAGRGPDLGARGRTAFRHL